MTLWILVYLVSGFVLGGIGVLWLEDGLLSVWGMFAIWLVVLLLWLPIVVCLVLGYAAQRVVFWWKGW